MPAAPPPPPRGFGAGLGYAIAAYVLWGLLPLYFVLLAPTGPWEVVALRILLALGFCALLLTVTRAWRPFLALARKRRVLGAMTLAGALIYVNWQVYVVAVLGGHVVEGSLGYFINPIVTVLLGVVFLRERLRPAQWVAVAVSALAILVITIGYGSVPWIGLVLAFSFGIYGYIKKRVGDEVDAVSGLTLETAVLAPVAIVVLVVVATAGGGIVTGTAGTPHLLLSLCAGALTAIPLLLFAAGARRLPLVYIGLTQYFAPVIQFLIGVVVLHEAMPTERWIGFGLVWVALVVLTIDMLTNGRAQRRVVTEPV
ncbi:MAG: EamA family transporter RarD [Schumannella sp.]|nr:EamA family transporter RarD [Microbacteriaceae bacterium]